MHKFLTQKGIDFYDWSQSIQDHIYAKINNRDHYSLFAGWFGSLIGPSSPMIGLINFFVIEENGKDGSSGLSFEYKPRALVK